MYKVGTRVKKVRGKCDIGSTGMVCHGPDYNGLTIENCHAEGILDVDMYVLEDSVWVTVGGQRNPAGTVSLTISSLWEPIIPEGSNVPSEASIHELLDSKFYEKEHVV